MQFIPIIYINNLIRHVLGEKKIGYYAKYKIQKNI